MQKRHSDRKKYFEELSLTCEKYYIPYINLWKDDFKNLKVLEIGCGDGGNLLPFLKKGSIVTGVDISSVKIQQAKNMLEGYGYNANFMAENIFDLSTEELGKFDLIVMHDVIEHIHEKEKLLCKFEELLLSGGVGFIGFPAWQMPFGGHQQVCQNKVLSKLPFIHLFHKTIYEWLLKKGGEAKSTIDELLDIKECKTSVELFEKTVRKTNLEIVKRTLYFINPHYEAKFNLKPRRLSGLIGSIPYIRNFFSTSCFYLLRKKEVKDS